MNETPTTTKAIILFLSGAKLADIRALPEVQTLLNRGATLALESTPITGPQAQHYAVLSGQPPACFGFFDTLVPQNYRVVEDASGRGSAPKMLPDLLRTVGWSVEYKEVQLPELLTCLQNSMQAVPDSQSCLIIKCVVQPEIERDITGIAQALRLAQAWVGEHGLLALLSDTQPAIAERFVNVNNFLADMGVLEREEQSGRINWRGTLAYHAGHGQLWVNLLGRDPEGAVHPQGEYEEVRDTLVRALPAKLRDPATGGIVIERVYRKEELYSGEYLFCAPDLVILFKPGNAPSRRSTRLEFDDAALTTVSPGQRVVAGVHPSLLRGFLVASSPAFAPGVAVADPAPLTVVVPTLLHALEVEHGGVDNPEVSALFAPSYLQSHPLRSSTQGKDLSEEEEELIISHLRDLGYV